MASLQTIRNKGGVIVAIIIGLALLSFVLGDMLTSGSQLFGSHSTAGKINGEDISIQEYSERVNYLQEINAIMSGSESATPEQIEQIQMQAWESFIREFAFMPAVEKIGLKTTNIQLQDLFYGQDPSPIITQIFTDPQTGMYNPDYLRAFVQNIDKDQTGRMSMFWKYLQGEVSDQATVTKLKTIVDKAAYTTKLQANTAAKLLGVNYDIRFVGQPFASIADSTIKITESDLKNYYETHKQLFRSNESKTLSYVLFETMPSNDDYMTAEKYISELTADFAAAENPMQFARANTQGQYNERYFSVDELSGPLATYAFSNKKDSLFGPDLSTDQYTLARIADVKNMPDSIDISHIMLSLDQTKTADSLLAAIKTGADFQDAAAKYSMDQQTANIGGKIGDVDPQTLPAEFSKELINTLGGEIKLVKTPQSIHIVKVNKVTNVKPRVQLAVIKYSVEPSDITRNAVYAKAQEFFAKAAGNADNYRKTISDSALIPRTVVITPNQRQVQGIPNSHEIVSWAYNNADNEKVSHVISLGDNFVVAALIDQTEKGFSPIEKVKQQITERLVIEKKAEIIAAKFKQASSLEMIATQINDSVRFENNLNFNTFVIPKLGLEPAIAGAVCALKPGQMSKPIIGLQGVYAVQIDTQTPNPTSPEIEKQRITAENTQTAFMRTYQAFLDMSDIKDLRYKFY